MRKRNYKAEYQRRLELGKARGLSRSQARGHARAGERARTAQIPIDRTSPFERALRMMKAGASQKNAAKATSVSVERLRRYQKENTQATRQSGRWTIVDQRPVSMVMATRQKVREITVPYDAASDIGQHWVAINRFLETNNPFHLSEFVGKSLRDSAGKFHPFETRPNVLRKLDSIGELSFVDIYRQTVQ